MDGKINNNLTSVIDGDVVTKMTSPKRLSFWKVENITKPMQK